MTPQEKAKELVDKYEKLAYSNTSWDEDLFNKVLRENAKKCAIIACDEVIKTYTNEDKTYWLLEDEVNYWQQVKQAINEL